MADTASLNKIADVYPILTGWLSCDEQTTTTVVLNGFMLSHDRADFPLIARTRIFDQGKMIVEHFSDEIPFDYFTILNLNEMLDGRTLRSGYYELSVFPKEPAAYVKSFFNEVWGTVYTKDGRWSVDYPLLISRGADPYMVDASYLYYPGVIVDNSFTMHVVLMNVQDHNNEYELILYDAKGENVLMGRGAIPPKSIQIVPLDQLSPDITDFYKDGPGMLLIHYRYKLNAFLQTIQHQKQIMTGMDHVGLLFAMPDKQNGKKIASDHVNANRLNDRLICYCKGVSESQIHQMKNAGMKLSMIQNSCGAGTVCLGCVPDLEKLTGEKMTWKRIPHRRHMLKQSVLDSEKRNT